MDALEPQGQSPQPLLMVGRAPVSVRPRRCVASARRETGRDRAPRVTTATRLGGPRAQTRCARARGARRGEGRPPVQTAPTMGGPQGSAGHVRPQRAVAPDNRRPDRADRWAGGAWEAPAGAPAPAHPRVRRVVRQAPPRAAAGRVAERKAEGEEAGEDARDKRVGGAQESHGGRRIVASDGERTVAACQCGSLSPGAPAGQLAVGAAESS